MLLTCAVALIAAAEPAVRLPAAELATAKYRRQQLVAALYLFDSARALAEGARRARRAEPERPIVLVWEDGRVVWSENALAGGPPYKSGAVEPARVTALVERFKGRDPSLLRKESLGPDATYATLVLRLPEGKYAQLKSWHPRDPNAKTLATSTGLVAREGRDPAAVLAKDTAEYQAFRKLWQELEDELVSVAHVATGAKPVTPKFEWDWLE